MAVLLLLVPASLFGLVGADQPDLHSIHRLHRLLLALVPDLPGLLFAVFGVAVLLGLRSKENPGNPLHLHQDHGADLFGVGGHLVLG